MKARCTVGWRRSVEGKGAKTKTSGTKVPRNSLNYSPETYLFHLYFILYHILYPFPTRQTVGERMKVIDPAFNLANSLNSLGIS